MLRFKPYFLVLKNWQFTKLWISQVCSQLTNYLLSFVVLIQAFKLTQSSLAVSMILVAFGLATVFFGSLAGVYADRFDRRTLLTTTNFLQAATVLLFIPFSDNFWVLALITFIYSSLNQFYLPSEAPSIPNLVPGNHLLIANSFFTLTASSAMIIGFALAGPVSIAFGPKAVFLAGSILLFIAGFATATLPSLRPKPHPLENHYVKDVWKDFKAGINHIFGAKVLHFSFFSLISAQIYNGMVITLAPAFIQSVLKINLETGTFFMIGPLGAGIFLGSLFLGWEGLFIKKRKMVRMGFLGLGIFTILIGTLIGAENRWIYLIFALFLGISNTHIFAPSHSILQQESNEYWRGRIYAALFLLLQMAATLPTIIIGLLAENISISVLLASLGLLLLGVAAVLPVEGKRQISEI